jgi:hypothetical protein
MGTTTDEGEIGEAMVLADLRRRGHGMALLFGHDLPFDLILVRAGTGSLEKVQCKYTESDGRVVQVRCQSSSDWVQYTYTADIVDWMAVYDRTIDRCYYLHSSVFEGLARPTLRLVWPRNGQRRGIRWARDHLAPDPPVAIGANRGETGPPLPFPAPPE